MLILSFNTGSLWDDGGLKNQPEWFIDLCSFFFPLYDEKKFHTRVKLILGSPKTEGVISGYKSG